MCCGGGAVGVQSDFEVTPRALSFLHSCGMDIGRIFSSGVSYTKGQGCVVSKTEDGEDPLQGGHSDPKKKEGDGAGEDAGEVPKSLPSLMAALSASGCPVVFHNGLLDCIFL